MVNEKHAHRDLCSILGWPKRCPEIKWIDIPLKSGEIKPHPVICPLEVFTKCMADSHDFWVQKFRGDQGACSSFWRSVYHLPQFRDHPILQPELFPVTVALGLHADGAPLTKHQSLFTISYNSLHSTGKTMDTRIVFTCIRKTDIGPTTMDALWKYFSWAMNALAAGHSPRLDWHGRRLTKRMISKVGERCSCRSEATGNSWQKFSKYRDGTVSAIAAFCARLR